MYFHKKSAEDVPMEDTEIWSCTKEDCNGWMRANFTFDETPKCRQCLSPMERTSRMLPSLNNSNMDAK
ncbi:MAG: cold-shock protein [Acidibacillus sp.]|uniref:Cold-shock protein n=1 Tax=Sulfoacidibacillus ferrooxidans TaxID=2005001 RepID=A0A9X1V627_9BACL|nr:cold-shock protein [Sulfoacidibacillus ferrooxidans]MCI0182326.1 hypothetical protein [Sulfoacidibacillus ferrooxidans]MCY0894609.1 cold-shock protein [Acidibacillus sp.]